MAQIEEIADGFAAACSRFAAAVSGAATAMRGAATAMRSFVRAARIARGEVPEVVDAEFAMADLDRAAWRSAEHLARVKHAPSVIRRQLAPWGDQFPTWREARVYEAYDELRLDWRR